ncbi:MAG: response regulator, partial [Planctomycetes bacterium]|nr:response regulator [Planctomycetota bacterium]
MNVEGERRVEGRGAAEGPLVLVVEDEMPVARFLRAGLAAQGYRVVECATGKEALRSAVQHVPDVVLLD